MNQQPSNLCPNNQFMYNVPAQQMNYYMPMNTTPMNQFMNCQPMYGMPMYNKPMGPCMGYQPQYVQTPQMLDSSMQMSNSQGNISASCTMPVMS